MTASVVFEILYKEYYVRVFGLCRRLLNSMPLAEDATQETFMRAYRNFDSYDNKQPFWQWIASIANNHCIDLLRRRGRIQKLFGDEEVELELCESPGKQALIELIEAEDTSTLNAAIAQLPDKYRVPLVLAYFNDSSYEQIAADLSISRNHVGVLLLRAKQHLRSSMADVGSREPQP
ncbi:MAG: RNA polymerase sigma factor [Proteobacteria bacterium]|nr:RNA polymerase sigma factor [Pseudomonadota bacterium]